MAITRRTSSPGRTSSARYRRRRRTSVISTSLLSFLAPSPFRHVTTVHAAPHCSTDADCARLLHPLSTCIGDGDGPSFCSNPYAAGCLRRKLGEEHAFGKMRVCNSDDSQLTTPSALCSRPLFDYTEIRIAASNWESSIFLSFVTQIVLSEILGVPATIETGSASSADGHLSFYDVENRFSYPVRAYPFDELRTANDQPNADCRAPVEEGRPCAHVIPEVWDGQYSAWTEARRAGYIDLPEGSGLVGKLSWYVPRFVARRDPTLGTYLGLRGEGNRAKLADTFLRPTSWAAYCSEVSALGCAEGGDRDGVAERAPTREELASGVGDKFHVPGLYRGHFRRTIKNDCTLNPNNCTGHIVAPPCEWSTNIPQQSYWNEIHLESDGPLEPNGGYSYGEMLDIWKAANETRSPVMMWWWQPEPSVQAWEGTPAEFHGVTLPPPTDSCHRARVSPDDRCSDDIWVRRGTEEGACDDQAHSLRKVIVAALGELSYDEEPAARSPAYEAVKNLRLSDLSINTMLKEWISRGQDTWGFDPREAVCTWVAENLDEITGGIPRGYPRELIDDGWYNDAKGLLYSAVSIAAIAVAIVGVSCFITYNYRAKAVIRNAQTSFLAIILGGCLLIAIAAIVYVLEPTLGTCIAKQWLVMLGYTLGIVPLLVKVYAINKITQGSKKFKRVILTRAQLLKFVAAIVCFVVAYLIVWTVVDPPRRQEYLVLVEDGGTVVEKQVHCSSTSEAWTIAALSWEGLLIVCATALAFQARNTRSEFNESKTLAKLVYAHFLLLLTHVIVYFLFASGVVASNVQSGISSIFLSCDSMAAIGIYFGPKFSYVFSGGYSTRRLANVQRHWAVLGGAAPRHVGQISVDGSSWTNGSYPKGSEKRRQASIPGQHVTLGGSTHERKGMSDSSTSSIEQSHASVETTSQMEVQIPFMRKRDLRRFIDLMKTELQNREKDKAANEERNYVRALENEERDGVEEKAMEDEECR